jgi:hypothetical protein
VRIAFSVFVVFHALVHLMYVGQALRWFELRPGMKWPTGAWAFSSADAARVFATVFITAASTAMIAGGLGLAISSQWGGWGGWTVVGSAIVLTVAHVLLWSGQWSEFGDHGGYGVVINVGIVATILAVR